VSYDVSLWGGGVFSSGSLPYLSFSEVMLIIYIFCGIILVYITACFISWLIDIIKG